MRTARILEILSLTPTSFLVTCRLPDDKLYRLTSVEKRIINDNERAVLVISNTCSKISVAELYQRLQELQRHSSSSLPMMIRKNSTQEYYEVVGISFSSFTNSSTHVFSNGITIYGE